MNDDFLHQMRKAPRPEFVARLKGKLDRQAPAMQPRPGLRLRRRRYSFVRGLITGLLLAGAGLAIAAVTLTDMPVSLHALGRVPMQFLARVLMGGAQRADQAKNQDHHRAVPLGPVWFPTNPQGGTSAHALPSAAVQASATTGTGVVQSVPSGVSEILTVAATSTTFTLAQLAAGRYAGIAAPARARVELSGDPFLRLCAGQPYGSPEVIEVVQRMSADYSRSCASNGLRDIIEVKLGYQAIVLVRAKQSGPLTLSFRDLFLGLSRQVPDPTQPGHLINNPNLTWDRVDPALPSSPIEVIGPEPGGAAGQLVLELVLNAGCKDALAATAPMRGESEEICRSWREDGLYRPSYLARGRLVDYLVDHPTVIGVLALEEFARAQDKLQAVSIDGIEPTAANVANGTYPLSRGIYMYAVKRRVLGSPTFKALVRYNMDAKSSLGNNPSGWGFVELDPEERTAVLTNVDATH